MLNILVCVKQVPDVNLVKIDPETGSLIRQGVPSILNPNDSHALEAAVQTKEKYGGTITCITMGPDMAMEALRECLSVGADKAVICSDRAFANADTLATSYVIEKVASKLGKFDLIFCGKESIDGATGQMGSQLAERFNTSHISSMSRILSVDEKAGTVTAERELEKGIETAQATLPCLFTVEKTNYEPRIPNLKSWKASRSADISKYDFKSLEFDPMRVGDPGSPTKVPRTYPPQTGELGVMIDEGSTQDTVDKLFELLKDQF